MPAKVLNDQQKQAIQHGQGPLLIIAGAGTGKTTVITERIKYLILQKKVPSSEILALTFTEKAAREMEERVDIALPYGYTQLWISTFHAFCDRILRSEAFHIGLNPSYILLTEAQTILFLRKNLFELKLDYFRPLGNPYKFLDGMLQHFNRLRDEDISPNQYLDWAQSQKSPLRQGFEGQAKVKSQNLDEMEIKKTLELAQAFKIYEELKAKEGVMDYANLIANTLKLFRDRPNILKQYQQQFQYILVDEFQDTNFAQNTLSVLISGERKNLTVVGDDDQAIYRWRGAAISNIIQFKKIFPQTKIITLTKNYRSTQEILDKSYDLVQYNNPDRLEVKEHINKKLSSMRKIKGSEIELICTDRVENEAEAVAKKIQQLTMNHELKTMNYQYKDFAILVRANDHSGPFTRALSRLEIPYQFLGPGRLFHQEEIKDLISYLKVLYNFEDSPSLYRVLNFAVFKLEPRDIAALLNFSKRKNLTLFEVLEKISTQTLEKEIFLKENTLSQVKKIYEMIKRHLGLVSKQTAGQILYYFLEDCGLLQKFLSAKTELETRQYQNIAKFFDKLKTYEAQNQDASVFAVVDWIDLSMQMGESPLAADSDWSDNNAVNILTVHSSKGLEFPVVFVVNLVTQRFPTRERREQIPIPQDLIKEILPIGDFHMQEERRLFYVAMTRARDKLFFTYANYYGEGKRERKISPFVYETLGKEEVEKIIQQKKEEQVIVQPTLLEWADTNSKFKIQNSKFDSANSQSITYLSYSQIQCFDICPLHYKLKYILKLPTAPSAAQSFGTSIHGALRDFYQQSLQGVKLRKDDIVPMLERLWISEGYQSKTHEKEAKARAKHILLTHLEKYYKSSDETGPIATEIPFQFYLRNKQNSSSSEAFSEGGLKIGGRIDRVDAIDEKTIEIIDYKTGTNMPAEKDLITDLQLTMYGLAATEVHDKVFNRKPEYVKLSLFYLEEDKKLTTTRTFEQLEEAKQTLMQKAKIIAESDFLCSGNSLCINCEYKMLCSAIG